jgi:hypothetical protein
MTGVTAGSDLEKVQLAFGRAIRDPHNSPLPPGVSARSMAVYHELFFNNFVSCLEAAYPVLHEVLDAELMAGLVRDFFQNHQSQTPEFPRLPEEFLRWLESRQGTAGEPAFLYELALWEFVELDVALDQASVSLVNTDTSDWQNKCILLNPTLRLLQFDYPVQSICAELIPETPLTQPVYLAAWRTTNDAVEFMELQPASAHFLQMMLDMPGHTAGQHYNELLTVINQPASAGMEAFVHDFIRELVRRQIITGLARSPESFATGEMSCKA